MRVLPLVPAIALVTLLTAGCDDSLAPEQPRFSVHAAQDPAPCHAVRGTIVAQLVPGSSATGTIRGDLEGTITTVLQPDPVGNTGNFVTGAIVHLRGRQTVEVTGGSISALIGRTMIWELDSRSVALTPVTLQVSNTLRVVDGAIGKLVSHGIIDLATLTTNFDYAGEICA